MLLLEMLLMSKDSGVTNLKQRTSVDLNPQHQRLHWTPLTTTLSDNFEIVREKFYPISVLKKNLKQKSVVIDNNWWQTVITKLLLTWYYCKELKILRIQSKYVQSQVSIQIDVDCKYWNQGIACLQWPIQNLIERKSIGTKINLIQTRYDEIYKGYKKIILFANINGKHLES